MKPAFVNNMIVIPEILNRESKVSDGRSKDWIPAFAGMTILAFSLFVAAPLLGEVTWESERLNLEVRMQQRVEEALSKIISPSQFVVVVRVDPLVNTTVAKEAADEGDGFVLPGVPTKSRLDGADQKLNYLVDTLRPDKNTFQKFIKRITVTLVIDKDLSDEVVSKARELTRQIVGLDPARGDMLDVQRTVFQKPAVEPVDHSALARLQKALQNYALLVILILVIFSIVVFILFVFGPLRGFLNNFVTTVATLRPREEGESRLTRMMAEQVIPHMIASQSMGYIPQGPGGGPVFSGSLQVENPNKPTTPFGFIRETHLGNLATLLSRESPERAAVVLGYLPPEWISRVLSKLEPGLQSEIADSLSTTRQLMPEQVEDIEQDLKRRLDYLVGGPDRIFAVYESLDPEGQKRMMDGLRMTRPDIAEGLRRRTLIFDDLDKLDPQALKSVLRDVERAVLVQALRGTDGIFCEKILEHMSEGKAQIVREELRMGDSKPNKATYEAQRKIMVIARRLEKEGQIQVPQIEQTAPAARFGQNSLLSSIKLPPGLKLDKNARIVSQEAQILSDPSIAQPLTFQDRVRKFFGRKSDGKETNPKEEGGETPES